MPARSRGFGWAWRCYEKQGRGKCFGNKKRPRGWWAQRCKLQELTEFSGGESGLLKDRPDEASAEITRMHGNGGRPFSRRVPERKMTTLLILLNEPSAFESSDRLPSRHLG